MKKKDKEIIFYILISVILVIAFLYTVNYVLDNYEHYSIYKDYCDENPSFCYCEWFICEYKSQISQTCINGVCDKKKLDENTKEVCDIARELEDTKILFKLGCDKYES